MKPANLVLTITMVSCLTLVVAAQRPSRDRPRPDVRPAHERRRALSGHLLVKATPPGENMADAVHPPFEFQVREGMRVYQPRE